MKIALDWIADYLKPVPDAPAVADALMNAGLPIESIEDAAGAKGPTKVLDVEVTSNRTDCFSHVGLAREIAALTGGQFALPTITLPESGPPAADAASVIVEDPAGCPYYSARILRNVKIGPSPDWLVKRLESIGLRPINNVVDITNYVLMELGQPLHAFDYDLLAEQRIIVRRARKNEKMTAIDGEEYPLDESMLVIADAVKPVAIAGVMGGKATEVTETTTTILLESARFDPLTIRTTSRKLGLKSDSSFRFERGIDPTAAELASTRAAQLVAQVASGQAPSAVSGAITVGNAHPKFIQISMRLKRFEEIVGIPISVDRAIAILSALGFAAWVDDNPGADADILYARVPPHRLDVEREIDLIEEIIRIHGYGAVPTLDRVTHAVTPEPPREKAIRAIHAAMTEAGFSEAVTVTFISEADAAAFLADPQARLIHPQHAGWKSDVLRPSVLPSLLAVRRTNQYAGIPDARIFEKAPTVVQSGDANAPPPPRERTQLGAVASDLAAVTGVLPLLADRLNPAAALRVVPQDYPFFVRGAGGDVLLEHAGKTTPIGRVGLITPEIQKRYDLRLPVAGLELDLEPLLAIFQPVRRANPVPRFPGVTRDLSVVVDESVRWADIKAALDAAQLAFLEKIEFVTTFRNKQVGEGKKSLTLTLDFRDPNRTLKSEEVDAQVKTAVEMLGARFGAALRT